MTLRFHLKEYSSKVEHLKISSEQTNYCRAKRSSDSNEMNDLSSAGRSKDVSEAIIHLNVGMKRCFYDIATQNVPLFSNMHFIHGCGFLCLCYMKIMAAANVETTIVHNKFCFHFNESIRVRVACDRGGTEQKQ